MRRFDIIIEADARVPPRGESVMLARRGYTIKNLEQNGS